MKTTGYNSVNSWIATFACAVVAFMVLIPVRLAGLFFVAIIDQYQTSRQVASLPISIFGTIRALGGPLFGHLGEVFGLRTIICIGSVLVAIGVGCCFLAEDVTTVIICLGLVYGTGLGFSNSLTPTVIRQHFNKNINLANGLYLTGACWGAMILSPVIQYLMTSYGISGMYLILSGILLNALPASMILKDPKNESKDLSTRHEKRMDSFQMDSYEKVELSKKKQSIEEVSRIEGKAHDAYNDSNEITTKLMHSENAGRDNSMTLDSDLHTYSVKDVSNIEATKQHTERNQKNKKFKNSNQPSLNESKNKSCCNNFQLFLDPTFLLQMCVNSIYSLGLVLHWTIIVDFGRDKGISTEWGVYFVMFLPISEMLGYMSLNWIVDRGLLSRTNFCIICFFLTIIASGVIIMAKGFTTMMVGLLSFGYIAGGVGSTFPGVIMEFIDKDKQNMALASRFALYGLFCLLKSPLIGFFRENLGSYNGVYYFIMVCCILCSICSLLTPISASFMRKRKGKL